ncbi:MAG: hypothetical protein M9958_03320 [Chitinophagales bacterium]|nr:hypothetical protein [Chitinophagales bacterium]
MITGFNVGQMQHFLAMSQKGNADLTSAHVNKILKVTPKDWVENLRFSGTMSNTMNLNKIGFGDEYNASTMMVQLHKKLYPSFMDQLKLTSWALTGNTKAIFNNIEKKVDRSYLYNMNKAFEQLKAKNFYFTFNSHLPFMGKCSLDDSLASLKYVYDNFPLKTVELENETYMSDYLTGGVKGNYIANIDSFFRYLEDTVVPEIQKIVGKEMPIGISFCKPANRAWKYWREEALRFAKRMKSKEVNIFLVPHVYLSGTSDVEILDALNQELADTQGYDVYITEFGTEETAPSLSQEQESDFMYRFSKFAQAKGVKGVFKHTLFVPQSNHFSFVK